MPTGLEYGPLTPGAAPGGLTAYALAAYPDSMMQNWLGALMQSSQYAPMDWTYKQIVDNFWKNMTTPMTPQEQAAWGIPSGSYVPPTGQLPPGSGSGSGGGSGSGSGGSGMNSPYLPYPAGSTNPVSSYGFGGVQTLNGFGIPGYETSPVVGGGSWEGTVWNGAPYSGLVENPIPQTDVTNPNSPYYRPIYGGQPVTTDEGTTTPGFAVNPAVPYQTTWYLQTYGGKAPPYINIHEQTGKSMQGIPAAKPGFNWASPQALAQLRGAGLPGGWTSILGFTPGGSNG